MKTRRIGILGYDGVQALDVAGPADTFTTANAIIGAKVPSYRVVLLSAKKGRIETESGLCFYSDTTLSRDGLLDTIIVPGGCTLRSDGKLRRIVARWLRDHTSRARRVASVCTGIYALAESGLLEGRSATTHWRYAQDVQELWKGIAVNADAIFIKDGKYYTSAGVTAGIDLCLAFIEEDFGRAVALEVARQMVVYLQRSGGQLQYSEPLHLQMRAKSSFGDIAGWIRGHLAGDLTVEAIAERVQLSPRHLNRKFKNTFGVTPADFVEELRLDEARWLLVNAGEGIDRVAGDVGYSNADTFRRAFERRFGVAPTEYRSRFSRA